MIATVAVGCSRRGGCGGGEEQDGVGNELHFVMGRCFVWFLLVAWDGRVWKGSRYEASDGRDNHGL
jgi:hypothetical protein